MVTNKEKKESGNYFFVRVVYGTKPRLIAMSTNLEYRERERQRLKRESGRQVSEAQREKELVRETKNKGDEFRWKNNMNILKWRSRCRRLLALQSTPAKTDTFGDRDRQ